MQTLSNLPRAAQRALVGLTATAALAGGSLLAMPAVAEAGTSSTTIFSTNFSGPAGTAPNQSLWSYDTGGNWGGGQELEYYTANPQNASLDGNGNLAITAVKGNYTGPDGVTRPWTSARLQTYQKFDFTYGQISARIRVPAGTGLLPQFWAVGDDAYTLSNWPACGEIDAMEMLGSNPFDVYGTIHGPESGASNGYAVQGDYHSSTSLAAGYHVYSATWTPSQVSFAVDGHTYKTITPASLPSGSTWPFSHPFFLVLDLTVGGPWAGAPNASTPSKATMSVNWVKVTQSATASPSRVPSRRSHVAARRARVAPATRPY